MKTITEIKTIDITTLVWFDRINGNSYFAQEITLNYGLEDSETLINPFQYGYSSFDYEALTFLNKRLNLGLDRYSCYDLKDKYGIIIRHNKYDNCKKRELLSL